MDNLARKNRDKVIDLLTERLTFERAGVKLYDRVIQRIEASNEWSLAFLIEELRQIRAEEWEHEEWLEAQIRSLGGDAHGETEHSKLIARESRGLEEVVLKGNEALPHLFHALLTAELVDNNGWELLVRLAEEADDRDMVRAFKKRLHEEEDHLLFIRKVVERFARADVLGQPFTTPELSTPTP
jgi:bacterioferritin (cytochrome b1)